MYPKFDSYPRGKNPRGDLGRSLGRKSGVLYDDYVKNRFVSGCAINKKDQEVVLHTQEVRGSSPCAPTIFLCVRTGHRLAISV